MLKLLLIIGCVLSLLPIERLVGEFGLVEAIFLLILHLGLMGLVARDIASWYKDKADLFNPKVLSAIFYWIKFILFNLICLSSDTIRDAWMLPSPRSSGIVTIIGVYALVGIGWLAFRVGLLYRGTGISKSDDKFPNHAPFTGLGVVPLLLVFFFILIGIWGNIGYAGGLASYIGQMKLPFFRSVEIISANALGSMKYVVAKSFLPVGLTILAYGLLMRFGFSMRRFIFFFGVAAIANYFLNCATGGRTAVLLVAFFAVVIANKIRRIPPASLLIYGSLLVFVIVLMGHVDTMIGYGGGISLWSIPNELTLFIGKYLSAFPGAMRLYTDVEVSHSYVNTIWPSLTGMWGGPTPLIIEQYMKLRHGYPSNVVIGPAPELCLNLGWFGVVIGMMLIGRLTGVISTLYERYRDTASLLGLVVVLFCFQCAPMNTFNISSFFKTFLLLNSCFYFAIFVFWCQQKWNQRW